jgi:hypothetical protein
VTFVPDRPRCRGTKGRPIAGRPSARLKQTDAQPSARSAASMRRSLAASNRCTASGRRRTSVRRPAGPGSWAAGVRPAPCPGREW